jgi:hypothetical protein
MSGAISGVFFVLPHVAGYVLLRFARNEGGSWRKPQPVIARSSCDEAIQFFSWLLDCFASLAMTGRGRRKLQPVIAGRDDARLPAPRPGEHDPPMGDYAARGFATS